MKLAIIAIGTRGDVEPHAALCAGLRRAGFDARLCAPKDMAPFLAELGIPFDPIPVSFRQLCGSSEGGALLSSGDNGLGFLKRLHRIAKDAAEQTINGIQAACDWADAVLYSPLGLPARYFAAERGIPAFATALQPLGRTGEIPHPMLGLPHWSPSFINTCSYRLIEQLFWQVARPLLQSHLKHHLKLRGDFNELYRHPQPLLFGFSPHVVARPRDWKPWMHATGYWNGLHSAWHPPADLSDFLDEGPAICIGFGSMNTRRIERIMKETLEAVRATRRRAVVLTGWSDFSGPADGRHGDVFFTQAVPHTWLFNRVTAVVSHGGAGTIAAALRSGIPSVVLPFFFDQGFWGRWLAYRGLGPPPLPFQRLNAKAVASALDKATQSQGIQARLKELAAKLHQEDGVSRAVSILSDALC
jgi:sterol 3beta-glucosyltransferase